ncbi:hypothetical protein IH785_18700 [candidate division KSB1 bacterium]|nr:hypothetical protein [candidate division KSB1 bacterium]
MNTTFYIEHYITEQEADSIEDLQNHFSQQNQKLMKDYSGQQEISVVIVIMKNDLTEPIGMLEVSAKDFKKLPDKELRRLFRLKKYPKEGYSALDVINRTFHFDNSREIEYFKKFDDEEFRSKYIDYLVSNFNENLN